ncbi:MAG: hypothetical protein ACI4L6_04075, partial [Candidatus Onthoplasma sp.]
PKTIDTNTNSTDSTVTDTQTDVDEQKEYSQTLQTVLNSNYYNSLIARMDRIDNDADYTSFIQSNYCSNIPYGFLEQQGYDIETIKKAGEAACYADCYILDSEPNNLYIECRVLNHDPVDYYDTYLLKYTLTDQELQDLNLTHSLCGDRLKSAYIQAPFFIQQLSYDKTAEVLGVGHIGRNTIEYYDRLCYTKDMTATFIYQGPYNGTASEPATDPTVEREFVYQYHQYVGKADDITGTFEIYRVKIGSANDDYVYSGTKEIFYNTANRPTMSGLMPSEWEEENANYVPEQATYYSVHNRTDLIDGSSYDFNWSNKYLK